MSITAIPKASDFKIATSSCRAPDIIQLVLNSINANLSTCQTGLIKNIRALYLTLQVAPVGGLIGARDEYFAHMVHHEQPRTWCSTRKVTAHDGRPTAVPATAGRTRNISLYCDRCCSEWKGRHFFLRWWVQRSLAIESGSDC